MKANLTIGYTYELPHDIFVLVLNFSNPHILVDFLETVKRYSIKAVYSISSKYNISSSYYGGVVDTNLKNLFFKRSNNKSKFVVDLDDIDLVHECCLLKHQIAVRFSNDQIEEISNVIVNYCLENNILFFKLIDSGYGGLTLCDLRGLKKKDLGDGLGYLDLKDYISIDNDE